MSATTQLVALLGWPVAHSRSPALHAAAFAAHGIDAAYLAFAVPPEALGPAVAGLAALGAVGANVTLPHKQHIMTHLARVEPAARALGAVNTLVREGEGFLGVNTDADGLVRALRDAGVAIAGRRTLILGAGGAARAAAYGLAGAGVEEISVAARREREAIAMRDALGGAALALGGGAALALDPGALRDAFARCELLVQATSATLDGGPEAEAFAARLPLEALKESAVVVDLVYTPRETAVLRAARARGLVTVDGLGMLAWQAALSFARWFDVAPPIDAMRNALHDRE